jgi:hypothetical protein
MRTRPVLALASLALGLLPAALAAAPTDPAAEAAGIGQKIESFTTEAITVAGDKQTTAPYDSAKAAKTTAYVVLGTRCPTSAAYLERFRELERTYKAKGVAFVWVYPNRDDPSDAKLGFHREQRFAGPMIDDQDARVARILRATRTSEVVVVAKDGTILYRGGVDDSKEPAAVTKRYAAAAFDEHLAGKPITVTHSQVFA